MQRGVFNSFIWVLAVIFMAAPPAPVQGNETTLTFRAPDPGPVSDAIKQVLEEAYAHMGISLRYVDMPRNRSLVEADNGRIAGELGRLADLDDQFKNLRRVEFPLFSFDLVLVADRRKCGLCGMNSVNNLAFISGMQSVLQLLDEYNFNRPTVQALDIQQLHLMFSNKRVAAVLLNDFEARQLGYYDSPHLIVTPLRSQLGYHYLHEQHAHLIPTLNAELERMHESGRINEIYRDYHVSFQRLNTFPEAPYFPSVSATAGLWRTLTHVDGTGKYWELIKRVFNPVTDSLELHTNSYQRAVLGLNEDRFDMLVGSTLTHKALKGVPSYTHFDYDRDLYAFTMSEQALDDFLNGQLERPVCYVAGYNYDKIFGPNMTYYESNSSLDCFAMLDMKRVGAVVNYRENMPDWITTPYVQHKLRDAVPIHVMFRDTPRGRELRDWFDKRVREMVESGEIREFFEESMLIRSHLHLTAPPLPESTDKPA